MILDIRIRYCGYCRKRFNSDDIWFMTHVNYCELVLSDSLFKRDDV
jgi:hypothetical protein